VAAAGPTGLTHDLGENGSVSISLISGWFWSPGTAGNITPPGRIPLSELQSRHLVLVGQVSSHPRPGSINSTPGTLQYAGAFRSSDSEK